MLVFAASSNSDNFGLIPDLVDEVDFFDDGTIITINFNTADQTLTTLLNQITYNTFVNTSMYNFIGSYTNWGKGYPNGTDGCAILDSDDGVTLVWKTYSCDTDSTGLAMVLCQARACDTSSTVCCADCHLSGSMKPKQKVYKSTGEKSKKNFIKRWTMKDGKPKRIA
uniref:C-type lectin domain-containing protein n=1 Tax=Acrobeloides nanus TaxID=290746 RepID=A0A914D3C2_9BILA